MPKSNFVPPVGSIVFWKTTKECEQDDPLLNLTKGDKEYIEERGGKYHGILKIESHVSWGIHFPHTPNLLIISHDGVRIPDHVEKDKPALFNIKWVKIDQT
jgi:hypothetical protein